MIDIVCGFNIICWLNTDTHTNWTNDDTFILLIFVHEGDSGGNGGGCEVFPLHFLLLLYFLTSPAHLKSG